MNAAFMERLVRRRPVQALDSSVAQLLDRRASPNQVKRAETLLQVAQRDGQSENVTLDLTSVPSGMRRTALRRDGPSSEEMLPGGEELSGITERPSRVDSPGSTDIGEGAARGRANETGLRATPRPKQAGRDRRA